MSVSDQFSRISVGVADIKEAITEKGVIVPSGARVNDLGDLVRAIEGENIEAYDGNYSWTPTTSEQTIDIDKKKAVQNITISPIPYTEVSNESGGITVSIG